MSMLIRQLKSLLPARLLGVKLRQVTHVKEATALIDGEGYLTYVIEPKLPDQFFCND